MNCWQPRGFSGSITKFSGTRTCALSPGRAAQPRRLQAVKLRTAPKTVTTASRSGQSCAGTLAAVQHIRRLGSSPCPCTGQFARTDFACAGPLPILSYWLLLECSDLLFFSNFEDWVFSSAFFHVSALSFLPPHGI